MIRVAILLAAVLAAPTRANPHIDYMLQCQGCHLADGSGSVGSVPDLRERIGLFVGVEGGREYLIRVPGSAQSPLSHQRLAQVLNWMIREFGPAEAAANFAPFTAEEVERQRRPLVDVEPVRAALLERIATAAER